VIGPAPGAVRGAFPVPAALCPPARQTAWVRLLSLVEARRYDPAEQERQAHVVLTDEGAAFFRRHCVGRSGRELMFRHVDGSAWQRSEQARLMAEACEPAMIKPAISFHILRHTWSSHAVMNGVPLLVVAKNLGHVDTRMVEKHYGHLAPSFIADAIRAGAPRYRVKDDKRGAPLR
jgi:integrase